MSILWIVVAFIFDSQIDYLVSSSLTDRDRQIAQADPSCRPRPFNIAPCDLRNSLRAYFINGLFVLCILHGKDGVREESHPAHPHNKCTGYYFARIILMAL